MRTLLLAALFISLPCRAANYYLANASTTPAGSDSNNGTSPSTPWLTPNHALNCGDVITAVASTAYSASNFSQTHWGTVTCSAQNNVAWLKCAIFDGCKISGLTSGQNGMEVHASYWGVQGWEVDGTSIAGMCFFTGWANIRNIIFANDIAVGCGAAGFEAGNYQLAGPDYFAFVGNIVYGNAGGSVSCGSGIEIYSPVAQDTAPGTHIYIAGNFSWGNENPNPCGGSTPTDGEGINFDTFDGSQTSSLTPYTPQAVADNNIVVGNGGRGFEVENNLVGAPANSHIYVRHFTSWGNQIDLNQTGVCACAIGEMVGINFDKTEMYLNLVATNAATGASGNPIYDFWATTPAVSDHIYQNVGWSATGTYSAKFDPGSVFSYGPNNLFGTNPTFVSPAIPGAPSCGSATSVPNCMATVIANFTPTNAAAKPYGYQAPSAANVYDPLYPQWLCNVTLPAGLVTPGCLAGSSISGSTMNGATLR